MHGLDLAQPFSAVFWTPPYTPSLKKGCRTRPSPNPPWLFMSLLLDTTVFSWCILSARFLPFSRFHPKQEHFFSLLHFSSGSSYFSLLPFFLSQFPTSAELFAIPARNGWWLIPSLFIFRPREACDFVTRARGQVLYFFSSHFDWRSFSGPPRSPRCFPFHFFHASHLFFAPAFPEGFFFLVS